MKKKTLFLLPLAFGLAACGSTDVVIEDQEQFEADMNMEQMDLDRAPPEAIEGMREAGFLDGGGGEQSAPGQGN